MLEIKKKRKNPLQNGYNMSLGQSEPNLRVSRNFTFICGKVEQYNLSLFYDDKRKRVF